MFGQQQQQQKQSLFGGGGNPTGGFGGSSAPSFGGGGATSGFGGGGGFGGGATSGFGGGGGFAGSQIQPQGNPGGGLFGGQPQQQANPGGGGLFGGQTQGMNQQTTGFGGATSGFGNNQQTQGFGANTSGFSSGFGGNNTSGFGNNGGFGQNKPAGNNGLFGGPQQTQGAAMSPFQQNSTSQFGGAPQGGGFGQFQKPGGGFNQPNMQQQPGKDEIQFYSPVSMQQTAQLLYSKSDPQFQQNVIQQEGADRKSMSLRFKNIRTQEKYTLCSGPMMRLCDMRGQQSNQPQPNYEYTASQQWNQQKGQYPLPQKLGSGQPQGAPGMGGGMGQAPALNKSSSLFGGNPAQSTGFGGGTSQFGFNQQQQNQQNNTGGSNLFGGASQQPQQNPGGLFGGNTQATTGFGQQNNTSGFGSNAQNSFGAGTGLGLTKQPATTSLFGGNNNQNSFGANGTQQNQTGGLFGGNNQPNQQINPSNPNNMHDQKSSLFGGAQSNPAQPAAGTGGGLFGNTGATSNPGAGGLFGGSQAPSTGLFGNNAQSNPKPGGAFGGAASSSFAAPSGGGAGTLFGGNTQTQQNAGGLFGANGGAKPAGSNPGTLFGGGGATSASGTGLFSKPSTTSTGLFGGGASTTSPAPAAGGLGGLGGAPQSALFGGGAAGGSSLFGGASSTRPATNPNPGLGGGASTLFGGNPGGQNQGGLFGAPSGGGLFSQASTTPGQAGQGAFATPGLTSQQQMMQPGNLNLQNLYDPNDDPLGLRQRERLAEAPHMNFEDEMRKIDEEGQKARLESNRMFEYQQEQIWAAHADIGMSAGYGMTPGLYRRPSEAEILEEKRQLERYEQEQERQYRMQTQRSRLPKGLQTMKSTFSVRDGFQTHRSVYRESESAFKQVNPQLSRQGSLASPMLDHKQVSTLTDYVSQHPRHNQKLYQQSQVKQSQNIRNPQSIQPIQSDFSKEIKNLEAVLPAYDLGNQEAKVFKMSFHQTYNVEDAIKRVQKSIQNEMKINIEYENMNFLHRSAILNDQEVLGNIEPQNQDITLKILIDPQVTNLYKTEYLKPKESQESAGSPQAESRDWVPNYPRKGHKCYPDYHDIVKMTKDEVSCLPLFKIISDEGLGEIEFLPPEHDLSKGIDLTYVDLQAFEIKHGMALGYEDFDGKFEKPEVNTKLNIPAIVTLKLNKEVKVQKLLNIIDRQNKDDTCLINGKSEHLFYENREWQFRVPHWSKWGLDDSDEEEGLEESKQIESQDISELKAQKKGDIQGAQSNVQAVQDLDQFKSKATHIQQSNLFEERPQQNVEQKAIMSQVNQRYGSQAYNDQFAKKQNVFLQSSQIHEKKLLPNPIKEKIMPTKYRRNKEVFAKIAAQKQKRQEFDKKLKQSELEYKRTQVAKDIKTLVPNITKDSQGNTIKNSHHLQIYRGVKPCFRPNGQLLTINHTMSQSGINQAPYIQTKAWVHQVKQVEESKVDMTEPILNNIKVQEVHHEPLQFDRDLQFKVLKSDNQQFQTIYDSLYFQTLIQKSKIPMVDYERTPKGIFRLLKDAVLKQLEKDVKPGQDLYVLCMLNALFGDPRIHLIHLHPTYRTHNNSNQFDKAMKLYENEQYRDVKHSHECSKQRRNAVTELIRQICFLQYGENLLHNQINYNHNDATLYNTAYEMLLNGQITQAVKFLGKHGKSQLARLVAMSVSTQESTKTRISMVHNQYSSQGEQAGFQGILNLITSKRGEIIKFPKTIKWHQALCSMLLYSIPTQFDLSEVIKNFLQLQQTIGLKVDVDGNEDVLLTLLKCYSGQEYKAIDQLNSFKGISCQRFQIQWFVQYVLRLYSEYENSVMLDQEISQKIGVVTRDHFNLTSCKLVDQMVKQKNYKSALLICLMMNDCESLLKRKTLVEVSGHACAEMFTEENKEVVNKFQKFFIEKLHLPPKFINVHVAMKQQSIGNFTGAFNTWIVAQNYQKAHDVLMTYIVPKSLGSRPALLETFNFKPSNSKKSAMVFKYDERKFIEEALEKLFQGSSQIEHWGENGLLLKEILQISQFDDQPEAQKLQKLLVLTKKLQSLGQSQLNCQELLPLRQALSEKLLKLESEMKRNQMPHSLMKDCETNLLFDQTIQQMRNPHLINRQFVNNINSVSQNMY